VEIFLCERYRYIRQGYVEIAIVLILWFHCPYPSLFSQRIPPLLFSSSYPNMSFRASLFMSAYPSCPFSESCASRDIARRSNSYRDLIRCCCTYWVFRKVIMSSKQVQTRQTLRILVFSKPTFLTLLIF